MPAARLTVRNKEVLRALVDLHISTGQPVGSESLARQMRQSVSPATIRNVLAEMERSGLLDHPHTSAGRVPTDDGYRLYVDSLMRPASLPVREVAAIDSELGPGQASSAEQVVEKASQVLSRFSRKVGFVLVPESGRTTFRHVDLVRLPHPRILVVMVSRTGLVTNRVIEVREELSQDDLQECANYLNASFSGMTLSAIRSRLLEMMAVERALYDTLLKRVLALGQRAFVLDAPEGDVYLDGTSSILDQPEFEDLDRMRSLLQTLEAKSRLVRILNACLSGEGVRIVIGHENPDPELRDLSLVTSTYNLANEGRWSVGVLGSTRMEYSRMIPLVDHVARAVTQALTELKT
jgi:heat-inducible transcriptional repressor